MSKKHFLQKIPPQLPAKKSRAILLIFRQFYNLTISTKSNGQQGIKYNPLKLLAPVHKMISVKRSRKRNTTAPDITGHCCCGENLWVQHSSHPLFSTTSQLGQLANALKPVQDNLDYVAQTISSRNQRACRKRKRGVIGCLGHASVGLNIP